MNKRRRLGIRGKWLGSITLSLIAGFTVSTLTPVFPASKYWFLFQLTPLATFFIAFFFTYFLLTRPFVQYLRTLADGLNVLAEGKLQHRVPVLRQDELTDVAANLNAMAERLESQIEKERLAEKSKMDLITGLSHDLRTPLTSIVGYLGLLKNQTYRDEAERDRIVENAENKALQLKKLIEDLFEYTRLTDGASELRVLIFDVRALAAQMAVEFEPIAAEHGASLRFTHADRLPANVAADPDRIRRALDNLLMNALKFSVKPGEIRMTVAVADACAEIAVRNLGDPVTAEQERQLFERFYKADASRSADRIQPGFGLGLTIARQIAELHGGSIRFAHENGSFLFALRLPLHG
ncbi:HAMP domain-containing sensor histidine kinase [Cohnella nanjingensis]|uniref:histidine kinase n=1 Tax=Cohnella nanjingensis TaxID=1387779 RepID=A0A7X0RUS1_9BACL|nr:HAMP domain-containing sensor histidine kinase [Cohnella nanjingensis]MBB6673926.1 HAMP domain-containing histidine kinase [Cohnella nanjingensis]